MKLITVDMNNYKKYLDLITESEKVFQEPIRLDEAQLIFVLKGDRPIVKVAFENGIYIGNIGGFCPHEGDIKEAELKGLVYNPFSIYLYNFVIIPEFQSMGFGKLMLSDFVRTARSLGFAYLEGHFRQNASLHIISKRMGAEVIGTYKNWSDTGEDYVHCRLKL